MRFLPPRIIPSLLLKDKGLVKGTNFKNHTYVGDPINAVKIYNDKEVDELCILNISKNSKVDQIPFDLLKKIASEAFMPMSYGGNINTIDEVEKLVHLGFEKIILNTSFLKNEILVKESVKRIGASSVVVSIDYKKNLFGLNKVYLNKRNQTSSIDVYTACNKAESLGVGEILLCSVDREGTYKGLDLKTIEKVTRNLSIPLIASGGAASLKDLKDGITAGASAVSAGNIFTFRGKFKAVMISYPKYSEILKVFN